MPYRRTSQSHYLKVCKTKGGDGKTLFGREKSHEKSSRTRRFQIKDRLEGQGKPTQTNIGIDPFPRSLPIILIPPAPRDRDIQIINTRLIHHPGCLRQKGLRNGMILSVDDRGQLAQYHETGPGDGEEVGGVVWALWRLLV